MFKMSDIKKYRSLQRETRYSSTYSEMPRKALKLAVKSILTGFLYVDIARWSFSDPYKKFCMIILEMFKRIISKRSWKISWIMNYGKWVNSSTFWLTSCRYSYRWRFIWCLRKSLVWVDLIFRAKLINIYDCVVSKKFNITSIKINK